VLTGFFIFVVSLTSIFFVAQQARDIDMQEALSGQETVKLIGDEYNAAVMAGEGYKKTFALQPLIANRYPYRFRFINHSSLNTAYVEILWSKGSRDFLYSVPLASRSIFAGGLPITETPAEFESAKGTLTFENKNGGIYVS